jgi:hypothetical protein
MSTITFTCPHCQSQTNFSSTAVGQQGKCSGCLQNVTIQPNLPPPLPNPSAKNKIIIIATVVCGAVVVLGLVLCLILFLFLFPLEQRTAQTTEQPVESRNEPANESPDEGPAAPRNQSSPEALGRSVFDVVKSDDMDAFIAMLPDAEAMETMMIASIKHAAPSEREMEEAEKTIRRLDFSALALEVQDKCIDVFNGLVDYRNWRDASIVTVVSSPRIHLGELTKTDYTFVVFELETELHVLVMHNSLRINEDWYFNDDKLNISPLSDMRTTSTRVLRDALQRTNDSNRNRILREMPRSTN